jgi:hypothetical protein
MKDIYAAMAKASGQIGGAVKDTNNPHFKTKYADLSSVVDAIRKPLSDNGLWFRQFLHDVDDGVSLETFACHSSGEEISFGKIFVPAQKRDAQGFGSALTYARRYGLMTAFGVCPEDDDGNSAVSSTRERKVQAEYAADLVPSMIAELEAIDDVDALKAWLPTKRDIRARLLEPDAIALNEAYAKHGASLKAKQSQEVESESEPISDQQAAIVQIRTLSDVAKVPNADIFKKYSVMAFNELTLDQAIDCIDALKSKIEKGKS